MGSTTIAFIGLGTLPAFAWACAAFAHSPAVSPALIEQDWTTLRRHFSLSGITFDFSYGYWRYGAIGERLVDCSNERIYCLASATFRVALPKRCSDLSAGHWAVGTVHTEIILRRDEGSPPIHEPGTATTLYLGSADRPHQLFVYDPGIGLKGLYWDHGNEIDFISMAHDGRLERWLREWANAETRRRYYFPLATLAEVGKCRG